jgi:poly(beta-D-mannuronate) lyase
VLATLLLFSSKALLANTTTVSSIAGLQKAINTAKPGDIILLTDGVYTTTEDIIINNKAPKRNQ